MQRTTYMQQLVELIPWQMQKHIIVWSSFEITPEIIYFHVLRKKNPLETYK